jgi:addiction module HigA family antidote
MAKQKNLAPGDVLKEKLAEYQLTIGGLAQELKMNQSSLRQILEGKTKISVPVAFRLAKYFTTPVQYWTDLQSAYEIAELKKDKDFQNALGEIPKAKKKKVLDSSNFKKSSVSANKKAASKEALDSEKPSGTRRRGRPSAAAADTDAGAEKPKRRRGRPPAADTDAGAERPKRRRGRPRAAAFDSVDVEDEAAVIEKPKPKTILIKKSDISPPPSDSLFEDTIPDDMQT